jgi:hypothetical protein
MADNLPLSSADVTESGSLNLPEPSGPHRPVMGLLYLYTEYFQQISKTDKRNGVLQEAAPNSLLETGVGSLLEDTAS